MACRNRYLSDRESLRGAAAARTGKASIIGLPPQRETGFKNALQPAPQAHQDEFKCLLGKRGINLRLQQGKDEK